MHDVEAVGARSRHGGAAGGIAARRAPRGMAGPAGGGRGVRRTAVCAGQRRTPKRGGRLSRRGLPRATKRRLEAARSDYMALFVGPGTPLAPPWESVCRHKDEALVFQKETLEVRAAYRELGLQVEKLHHEPDDHIAYELEFSCCGGVAGRGRGGGGGCRPCRGGPGRRCATSWSGILLGGASPGPTWFWSTRRPISTAVPALMVKGCLQEAREQSAA